MWESRSQGRAFGAVAQKRTWMREVRPLIAGQPLTPFQRVAVACDFASPLANSGSAGLAYINVDITLYLHRYPCGEWIGFESTDHGASDGIAMGQCRLYDEQGPIGAAAVAAVAQLPPRLKPAAAGASNGRRSPPPAPGGHTPA
ncbi:hypothetical protein [Tepidiforma flava]